MNGFLKNIIYRAMPLLVAAGCNNSTAKETLTSPKEYNLRMAYETKLPLDLDEISGVAYYSADSSLFAINDEKGWLYKLKKGQPIRRWKFSGGADFEDVVLLDSVFYVLQSNGNILRLSFVSQSTVAVQKFQFPQGETKNEFEILYYDSGREKLILMCKDCEADTKKTLTTFSFDPYSGAFSDSSYKIDIKEIARSMGEDKIKFKPSAACINPKDSLLYIISAINKLIVTTDVNGKFKGVYQIDASIFKQPEGITFTPAGGMIVSNEAADVGVANILYFPYTKR
jgi:uncharacterized protein YjiK